MANTQTLTIKRTIQASPPDVYRALTNSSALREWLCDVALLDLHKGGRVYLAWNDGYHTTGYVTAVTPDKTLAFSWRGAGEPDETRVRISLKQSNGGTGVTVTHSGFGSGKAWAKAAKGLARGWGSSLENLQSVMETGHDLRITLRPMLGITVGEFNSEVAAKLGVPVSDGIRLDGTLEGMGAHAAGLRKDDVVVGAGGKKVVNFPSLANALQSRRAGDKVAVVFYRGKEKMKTTMELSPRPLPEVPPTARELADALRAIYAELDPELDGCFAGVSEAEVSYQPAPDEWSARDVVAHLLAGERDNHSYMTELVSDAERYYDVIPGNVQARHEAIYASYPAAAGLLADLKRAEAETVALIAALPPEFVARKRTYWRLGYNLLQPPFHTREHFNQIRAAIEAARKQ